MQVHAITGSSVKNKYQQMHSVSFRYLVAAQLQINLQNHFKILLLYLKFIFIFIFSGSTNDQVPSLTLSADLHLA